MPRILNVEQSNYRLRVQKGGTIYLDTGTGEGDVIITGNLTVKGTTSTIESIDTTIKDNILYLNYGETGSGISLDESGIQIQRGLLDDAFFVYSELVDHYDPQVLDNVAGTFVFKTNDGTISGINTNSIVAATDIVFDLQNQETVLRIVNTTDYSSRVLNENDIPNKKYINDYVVATNGMADVDKIFKIIDGSVVSRVQAYDQFINFYINENLKASLDVNKFEIDTLSLSVNTVSNSGLNNLKLTADNNYVEVDAVLKLNNQTSYDTGITNGTTKIYSRADLVTTTGDTGIFFVNSVSSDELVSRNRALLFSILF